MLDQELAFASLLDQELIRQVFAKHRSLFGGVFHTAIVLWAFLSQSYAMKKKRPVNQPSPASRPF
jgi:hypothetical protein